MPGHFSPAAAQRARDLDRALDADRAGRDKNRNAAQIKLEPSHKESDTPNRGKGLKR
jgi:hypothetical protein